MTPRRDAYQLARDREAAVVTRAVDLARQDRTLRSTYGLGWLGWLMVSLKVATLIRDLIDAYRAKMEAQHEYGLSPGEAYDYARAAPLAGTDPALFDVLKVAEGEIDAGVDRP